MGVLSSGFYIMFGGPVLHPPFSGSYRILDEEKESRITTN